MEMNPIASVLAALKPMLPKKQPVRNPVSEFVADLLEEKFGDIPEAELLNIIGINNSNADPNGVLDLLVDLHERIGVFVTRMQDGEFENWTAPEAETETEPTPEADAVLELP